MARFSVEPVDGGKKQAQCTCGWKGRELPRAFDANHEGLVHKDQEHKGEK